jgi:hypothetical protein
MKRDDQFFFGKPGANSRHRRKSFPFQTPLENEAGMFCLAVGNRVTLNYGGLGIT